MWGDWYDMKIDNDREETELWLTWKQWVWQDVLRNFEAYGAAKRLPVNVPLQKRFDSDGPAESVQLSLLPPND